MPLSRLLAFMSQTPYQTTSNEFWRVRRSCCDSLSRAGHERVAASHRASQDLNARVDATLHMTTHPPPAHGAASGTRARNPRQSKGRPTPAAHAVVPLTHCRGSRLRVADG